ncbi:MAG: GAF domain-containing protein [Bacteroidales bacterium]|nr:GAF domain-containing protein [Bacteroidales bacterium]
MGSRKAYLEFDEHNKLIGGFGITQDITLKKLSEDALRKSEERFKLLAEISGNLLQSTDPHKLIHSLCLKVMDHLNCQMFFNYIVDEQKGKLYLHSYSGVDVQNAKKMEWLEFGSQVCGCVARDNMAIVVENIPESSDPRTQLVKKLGIRAYACHPLLSETENHWNPFVWNPFT